MPAGRRCSSIVSAEHAFGHAHCTFLEHVLLRCQRALMCHELRCRFGAVESVRLRSLPLKEGLKMPRKAAVASGNVDAERAPAHAYVVFEKRTSAVYALQLNMSEVSPLFMTLMAAGEILRNEFQAHRAHLLAAAHTKKLAWPPLRLQCVFMLAFSTLQLLPGCHVLSWHMLMHLGCLCSDLEAQSCLKCCAV